MKKYDCLNRETQITGSHILEASAGTGKTFAIEHLFVRLLIEPEKPLLVDEILVVTFTKAAARDLKDRIRKNIQNVLRSLQDEIVAVDYLHLFLESEEKKIASQRRLQEALYFFDRCQIFTIHGFCFRMLNEYRYCANVLIEKNIKDQSHIISDEIKSYFFHNIEKISFGKYYLSILLQKYPSDKILLKKIIRSLTVDQDDKNKSFNESYQIFLKKIFELKNEKTFSVDIAKKTFTEIFPFFKKNKKTDEEGLLFLLEKFLYVIENQSCSLSNFDILGRSLNLLFLYFTKENQKKKFPENVKINFLYKFIQKAKDELLQYLDILNNPSVIIRALTNDLSNNVLKRLKTEQAISHDDLLKIMLISLNEKDFAKAIRKKYLAAIIDEFQDTDKLQWEIFETLFLQKKTLSSLFLVGDPKQAIYRFRKADVYTYLQASDFLGQKTISFLDTNYRSSSKILNVLNRLFSNEMAHSWLSLPKTNTYLPYLPIKASKKEHKILKDDRRAVHFYLLEDFSHTLRGPSLESENLLYEKTANEIVTLKENNCLNWEQMAILVRDRYQSERIKTYLDRRKIPYQSKSHILLGETKSANYLLEIFEAIISPKDSSKLMIAMATPYFGCDSTRLSNLSTKEKEEIQYIFHHFHNLLKMKKMNIFITKFLSTKWDNETIQNRMARVSSLSFYRETMQILQDLLEKFPSYSFSLDGILSFFKELNDQDVVEEEKRLLQPMHDEKGIQILTIHMSKGLEFDIVFVLGAIIRSPFDEDLIQEEIEELDAEKLRQFYVAMTRAKIRVYLPVVIDMSGQIIPYGSACLNELFFAHLQILKGTLYERIQNLSKQNIIRPLQELIDLDLVSLEEVCKENPIFPIEEKKTKLFFSKKSISNEKKRYVLSFSSIAEKHEKSLVENENESFLLSSSLLPLGAPTGVIIHEIFEKIFSTRDIKNRAKHIEIIEEVTSLSFLNEKKDILYKMVEKTLSTPLLPYDFTLQDLNPDHISVEMEFLFPLLQQNFMKGFIDMVFFHQDKYFILDWKSNWLGNGDSFYDLANLKKEMKKNQYDLQAAIYAETLRRYFRWEKIDRAKISFGGIFYLFIRGIFSPSKGIYHFYPEMRLLDHIEDKEKGLCLDC